MLGKLALRNVKRQVGSYFIYFITVAMTVSLMYAINNMMFSKEFKSLGELMDTRFMVGFSISMVSFVSAIVLSYAASFMLKLRKREFGIYLTTGMTRGEILKLYMLETLVMSGFAIVTGLVAGLFIYQLVMMLLSKFMNISYKMSAYSGEGLILTLVISVLIFLVSSVASFMYLKKVKISDLLHGENYQKPEKRIWPAAVICAFSLAASVYGIVRIITSLFDDGLVSGLLFMKNLILIVASVFIFHMCLARSLSGLLLKNRKRKNKGANVVVFRGLASKAVVNSILIGALGTLLTVAIGAASVSFIEKHLRDETLDMDVPFDAMFFVRERGVNPKDRFDAYIDVVEKECVIDRAYRYNLYTVADDGWAFDGIESINDSDYYGRLRIIKLSDFNRLMSILGEKEYELGADEVIRTTRYKTVLNLYDNSTKKVDINGKSYVSIEDSINVPDVIFGEFGVVMNDEDVEKMEFYSYAYAAMMKASVSNFLEIEEMLNEIDKEGMDTNIFKQAIKYAEDAQSGVLVISMLYLATVLVCLSLAILAIKTLSGLSDDKVRYETLSRLGMDEEGIRNTIKSQIRLFFGMPFVYPLLFSIPMGYFCYSIYKPMMIPNAGRSSIIISVSIDLAMILIYAVYYQITVKIASDYVIN